MPVMSINVTNEDMVNVSASRDAKARRAGQTLYQSISGVSTSVSSMPNGGSKIYSGYGSETFSTHRYSPCSTVSSVRRTFLLFITFDLFLTLILWIIYTQLIGKTPVWDAFVTQVQNYDFKTSLFDTVMMAAVRFTLLMLAYALFRINHWWMIAITTFLTCAFLLTKVFIFKFSDYSQNPLSYCLLIISFVISWIETWFLDFKVLPSERKAKYRAHERYRSEHSRLLGDSELGNASEGENNEYYSPIDSPAGSDDEGEHDRYRSIPHSRSHSRQASHSSINSIVGPREQEYLRLAREALEALLEMANMDEGWKLEKQLSEEDMVQSCYISKLKRKVFKLQGLIDIAPQKIWEDTIVGINDSPRWNPTLLSAKTLEVVDDSTDVSYNIAAEAVGGLVAARDFVNLRHWKHIDNMYVIAVNGSTSVDMPPQKKYVRGESGPGGMIFKEVQGDPNKCLFQWYLNSNLKGWIPQQVIDQGLTSVLNDYLANLRGHVDDLNSNSS